MERYNEERPRACGQSDELRPEAISKRRRPSQWMPTLAGELGKMHVRRLLRFFTTTHEPLEDSIVRALAQEGHPLVLSTNLPNVRFVDSRTLRRHTARFRR